jgi:hypothetical protein
MFTFLPLITMNLASSIFALLVDVAGTPECSGSGKLVWKFLNIFVYSYTLLGEDL